MPQAPKQIESSDQCARIERDIAGFKKTHAWPKDWYPIVDKSNPQDQAITKRMSESWAAFAKTGNPNVSGQLSWPIYNMNADVMRNYSDGPETITGLLKDRVAYQMLHLREIYALERLKNAF